MTVHPRPALHLPDLPEIPVQLGLPALVGEEPPAAGQPPRPALSWGWRLRQGLSTYLPLLLMAMLTIFTWWLVRNTPQPGDARSEAPPRVAPDYTMNGFSIVRFSPEGRVVLRIAGDVLRHFPATDVLEIEGVRIHAVSLDGRITDASARRALATGDGSEVQLLGGAQVLSQLEGADMLEMQGEFLHAFLRFEQLRSHLPVRLRRGNTETHAGGLEYDHLQQQLRLAGPVRITMAPAPRNKLPVHAAGASPTTSEARP